MNVLNKVLLGTATLGVLGLGAGFSGDTIEASESTYTVKSGDTLNKISDKVGLPVDSLAEENGISNIHVIFPGEELALNGNSPVSVDNESSKATPSTSVSTNTNASVPHYVYQVVEAEAGLGYSEKAKVASVIVNRANEGRWGGSSLLSVVKEPGQFVVHASGTAAATTPSNQTIQAVNDVVNNGVVTSHNSFKASGNGTTNIFHTQ